MASPYPTSSKLTWDTKSLRAIISRGRLSTAPDYAKMYKKLFNAQTDAISILQKGQQQAEEIYVSSPEPEVKLLPQDEDEPDN